MFSWSDLKFEQPPWSMKSVVRTGNSGSQGQPDNLVEVLLSQDATSTLHLSCLTRGQPVIQPRNRVHTRLNVAMVENRHRSVTVNAFAPRVVLLDIGAQPVIIGGTLAARLKLTGTALQKSAWSIRTASGSVESVNGETLDTVNLAFKPGTRDEVVLKVKCLVTKATNYDILIGMEALFPPGFCIDTWTE